MFGDIVDKRLEQFAELLLEWNKTHSLTSCKDKKCVFEYINDSTFPAKYLDKCRNVLDIGSGNGFPAIPLAITMEDAHFTLCESNAKKVSFLNFVIASLGLKNAKAVHKRVEDLEGEFDLITSRAVGSVELLKKISSHLYAKNYQLLLYKGQNYINEIKSTEGFKIIERDKRVYLIYKGENVY